jgi:GntR family transcriptional regulator
MVHGMTDAARHDPRGAEAPPDWMHPPLADPALLPARPLSRENGLLYQQLVAILKEPIASGAFSVGSMLPTEASLAERFGVSLITVRQALRELESEGMIKKRAAKAALVTRPPPRPASAMLNRFADIGADLGGGRLDIKSYRKERSRLAADTFGLGAREQCWCLRAVLVATDQRMAQITIFFPPDIGSRLRREQFDDVVVYHSVERHLGIRFAGARATLSAELADADLARDLDYSEGAPVLVMQFVYRSLEGRPIELTIAKHPADRYSISFDVANETR